MEAVVYYTNIPLKAKIETFNSVAKKMPLKRYQEFLQLEDEKAKLQNITAYLLLLKILNDHNIEIDNLDLVYSENGKPYFKNLTYQFSISHCDDLVAVAIDNDIIGIDVEKVKKTNSGLISRLYSMHEQDTYQDLLVNEEFFCKTWTIKESYAKAIGKGLYLDFPSISFYLDQDLNTMHDLYIKTIKTEDFYISLCSKKQNFQIQNLQFEELSDI